MANNDGNAPSDGAKREGPLRRAYNYIRHPRTSRSRRRRTPANITQPPAGPSTAQNVPPAGSSAAPQNDAPNDGQNNAQDDQAGDQHDQQSAGGPRGQPQGWIDPSAPASGQQGGDGQGAPGTALSESDTSVDGMLRRMFKSTRSGRKK